MRKKHPMIRKNDKVTVLVGKEKGKIGSVLKVDSEKSRVIVKNLLLNLLSLFKEIKPQNLVTTIVM